MGYHFHRDDTSVVPLHAAVTARIYFAWGLLALSIVGWPLTALTVAAGEPPVVLGLSWGAIALTAVDILSTQYVRRDQDDN